MIRLHWSTGALGPKLRRDAAWYAAVAGIASYLVWQLAVGLAALSAFLDRAGVLACPSDAACGLVDGWSDGFVGFVALALMALSLGVVFVVFRVLRGAWRRHFWVPLVGRVLGWTTFAGGLVTVLGWGLPWLVLGLWIALASQRLRYEGPEAAADPDVIEGERV